jgi:hypothetical protein
VSVDFNFVTSRVATGGQILTGEDVATLKAAGVSHIVNCQNERDDAPLLEGSGLFHLWAGTPDDGLPKPLEWTTGILSFALMALCAPNTKVYCHCAAGIDHGPSAAYAVLRGQGLGETVAEGLIRAARPFVGLRYKHDVDLAILRMGGAPAWKV